MVLLKIATKKEHLSLGTGRLNLLISLNLAQNDKWLAGKPAANFFFIIFVFSDQLPFSEGSWNKLFS